MPNPIVHFEIMGADTRKTQEFYGNLFGWTIDSNNPANYGITSTKDENGLGIDGGSVAQGRRPGRGRPRVRVRPG